MLSVGVVWNIFQGALRCPSSVSTWQFSVWKTTLQEHECSWGSGPCISDFKFALQTNLVLLITCLPHLNSAMAPFTACTSLDYIQGWIVLRVVHCTERHSHTFRWVSCHASVWVYSHLLGTCMFWLKSLVSHWCELLCSAVGCGFSHVTYMRILNTKKSFPPGFLLIFGGICWGCNISV